MVCAAVESQVPERRETLRLPPRLRSGLRQNRAGPGAHGLL